MAVDGCGSPAARNASDSQARGAAFAGGAPMDALTLGAWLARYEIRMGAALGIISMLVIGAAAVWAMRRPLPLRRLMGLSVICYWSLAVFLRVPGVLQVLLVRGRPRDVHARRAASTLTEARGRTVHGPGEDRGRLRNVTPDPMGWS